LGNGNGNEKKLFMKDLTVIFLTVNRVPEDWAAYQKNILLKAIGDTEVITISKNPMNWGLNLIQNGKICASNIYYQMLRGAIAAKTPYIAIAEDDVLYTNEHFQFRPQQDEFGYNMSNWGIFTWGEPTYFFKYRIVNSNFIGPRELTIKALEERFRKYPNGTPEDRTGELGRERIEARLGLPHYKTAEFWSINPNLKFNHDYSIDPLEKSHRKRMGKLRAYDIPYWGKAQDIVKKFT